MGRGVREDRSHEAMPPKQPAPKDAGGQIAERIVGRLGRVLWSGELGQQYQHLSRDEYGGQGRQVKRAPTQNMARDRHHSPHQDQPAEQFVPGRLGDHRQGGGEWVRSRKDRHIPERQAGPKGSVDGYDPQRATNDACNERYERCARIFRKKPYWS